MSDDPVTTPDLVAAYRASVRPSPAARERMASALAAAASREATVISLHPSRAPAPPRRTSSTVWLALAAALVLLAASTYWLIGADRDIHHVPANLLMAPAELDPTEGVATPRVEAPAPIHKTIAAPPAEPPITPTTRENPAPATPEPAVEDAAPRRPTRPPAARPAATSERDSDGPGSVLTHDPVLAELMLIQQIKDDLDAGRPAAALKAIDEHARTFARGSLSEEREALRVVALCDAGERDRGVAGQARFLATYPRSAYRQRVRAACPESSESTTNL